MAISACGLTADFGGLQGGSVDAGAGNDAADVAVPDAGTDVDAANGFCASLTTQPHLCADFDEGRPVVDGWTKFDVYNDAPELRVDDSVASSPPASFLSSLSSSANPSSARLQETLPTSATHVHMECMMLLQPTDGNFELFVLHEQPADGSTYGVYYKEEARQLSLFYRGLGADGGLVTFTRELGAPPADWLHVEIDIDVADNGSIVVKHNGAVVVNQQNYPTSTASRTDMFVDLGFYSFDGKPARANFDNVVIDWH